jgi:hypothetical protein
MDEDCRCDKCRYEKFYKIVGKLPLEERCYVSDIIAKIQKQEYFRGVYLTGLMGLLVILGFVGGLALFL